MATKFNHAVDNVTGSVATIATRHHAVHQGKAFTALHIVASIGNGEASVLRITAPNNAKRAHFLFAVGAPLPGIVLFHQAPVFSSGGSGTALAGVCLDLNNTSTGPLQIAHSATVSASTGTLIGASVIGGGGDVQSRVGDTIKQDFEYILKQGTDYSLQYIAGTNQTNVLFELSYYERD